MQNLSNMLLQADPAVTDARLLADFISRRDDAALATLVRRHGPMVWGVCRRVLANHHDVEDAFQATFLVLVRRAPSITRRELLANWLYGVAHQTAMKLRATAIRRSVRERQVAQMPDPPASRTEVWDDVQALLDRELSRMPGNFRSVIVLCELEGKTRKEAAHQLRVPEGTVASRLVRAKAMLASRLTRRGVVLSAAMLAAALSKDVASAAVPAQVLTNTIKAAHSLAAGQAATDGLISSKVAALTEGVVRTVWLTTLKAIAVVLFVVPAMAALGLSIYHTARGPDGRALPTQNADRPTADALQSDWGDAVNSLQVRVRLEKARWSPNEVPLFELDLRNNDMRTKPRYYSPGFLTYCEIEVDGQWYGQKTGPISGVDFALSPGETAHNWIRGFVDGNWQKGVTGAERAEADSQGEPFKLEPGKHQIRMAYAPLTKAARLVSGPVEIDVEPPLDKSKVDRSIGKEPAYKGPPGYCLLVFGPQACHRIWLVLDADAQVLHVDRHGDGNLTRSDARVEATAQKGGAVNYKVGDIFGSGAAVEYSNVIVTPRPGGFDFRLQPKAPPGQVSSRSFTLTSFAGTRKEAPVVRLDVDGPQ